MIHNPISLRGLIDWKAKEEGPAEVELTRSPHMSAVCLYLQEGEGVPGHKAERDMFLYVDQGRVVVTAGEGRVEMGPGQTLVIPAGASRGVEARERAILIVVQSPPDRA